MQLSGIKGYDMVGDQMKRKGKRRDFVFESLVGTFGEVSQNIA
jgi:hypothetical protein